jgi:hypothetical protein
MAIFPLVEPPALIHQRLTGSETGLSVVEKENIPIFNMEMYYWK